MFLMGDIDDYLFGATPPPKNKAIKFWSLAKTILELAKQFLNRTAQLWLIIHDHLLKAIFFHSQTKLSGEQSEPKPFTFINLNKYALAAKIC